MGKVSKHSEEMVLTPGGWRAKSLVHKIETGHHLSGAEGRLKKIHTESGKIIEDYGVVRKSNIKEVLSRIPKAVSKRNKNGTNDPAPTSDGWIVNSEWTNNTGNPISYFSSQWQVPPPPATNNNQLIYLFNGLQQTNVGPYILQPVLQWGVSPAGGGSYWAIANWYVGGQNEPAFFASLVQVNSGDNLQGTMALTGQSGNNFNYISSFAGFPAATLNATDIEELKWANETLECYGLEEFSDYPNTVYTAFTSIEIKVRTSNNPIVDLDIPLSWITDNRVTDNGQQCVIVSNTSPGGEVDIYYKTAV